MIQSPIENDYIKVKLDDANGGTKNGKHQKVILSVSIHKLNIDILNKYSTMFNMAYNKKRLFCISNTIL